jgi:hypothetical protein|tara:strand:+ start:8331 stop:9323 length:993 start_codon:yes stop_codon:yes gene_type:complete
MSLMVVYNVCGLSGKENSSTYIEHLNSILKQNLDDKKVIFSGCLISKQTFENVYKVFKNEISYYLTNEQLAVNQSFNHAVLCGIKEFGEFDGYVYVASDVKFTDDLDSLTKLHNRILNKENGIVSPEIDRDNGYYWWFDFEESENIWDVFGREKDFVVPLGSTANLHCAVFSNKIVKEFGRPLPDVFVSYCSESSFSFLVASVKQQFIIANDVLCNHGVNDGPHHQLDGQTQVYGGGWDLVFPGCRSIKEIVESDEAKQCGFGHEEWVPRFLHKMNVPNDKVYLMHDEKQFDEDNFSIDERLKNFIKNNLFLDKSILDYDTVVCKFIKGN